MKRLEYARTPTYGHEYAVHSSRELSHKDKAILAALTNEWQSVPEIATAMRQRCACCGKATICQSDCFSLVRKGYAEYHQIARRKRKFRLIPQ